MSVNIERLFAKKVVTLVANTCESETFRMQSFPYGAIHTPSAWTAAAIAFKSSPTEDGTYVEVRGDDGALLRCASVGPSMVTAMPADVAALGYVRLWSEDGAEGDVNQAADRELTLYLKG